MNCYEMMILTNPHLEEKEQKNVIESIKSYIENNSGKVVRIDNWGKRSTSYKIKHYLEAYYDIIYYELEPKYLPELERRLRLKESVLRYLNLKIEKEQIQAIISTPYEEENKTEIAEFEAKENDSNFIQEAPFDNLNEEENND